MQLSETNDCEMQNELKRRGIPLRNWKRHNLYYSIDYPIKNKTDFLCVRRTRILLEMENFHMRIITNFLKAYDLFSDTKIEHWVIDNK